ncbi:MAG TPA: hypothetical protein VHX44_09385 [Planctomycetota bacterium]|nr:hypothetical protein [Planctomycetota bacterium]
MSPISSSVISSMRRFLLSAVVLLTLSTTLIAEEIPTPTWTVPAGWTKLDQQKPMRYATFTAGEGATAVEVVISTFPGDVGGLWANVNRWRGQVALAPIPQDQLAANVTPFEVPGFTGNTMRLKGEAQHLLGAVIKDTMNERSWFVKLIGSPAAIDAQEALFLAFAKSFAAGK